MPSQGKSNKRDLEIKLLKLSFLSVDLFEGAPDKKVNLAEVTKSGKYVIFGVPGAFTPGCSKTHLPGYVSGADGLKVGLCVSIS